MLPGLDKRAGSIHAAGFVLIIARVSGVTAELAVSEKACIALTVVRACTSCDASRVLVTISVVVFAVIFGRAATNLNPVSTVALIASAHVSTSSRHVTRGKNVTATIRVFAVVNSLAF